MTKFNVRAIETLDSEETIKDDYPKLQKKENDNDEQ